MPNHPVLRALKGRYIEAWVARPRLLVEENADTHEKVAAGTESTDETDMTDEVRWRPWG